MNLCFDSTVESYNSLIESIISNTGNKKRLPIPFHFSFNQYDLPPWNDTSYNLIKEENKNAHAEIQVRESIERNKALFRVNHCVFFI